MSARVRVDFDGLMRHLTVVGFAALTAWTIVSTTGLALGLLRISPHATLRFLLSRARGGVLASDVLGAPRVALASPPARRAVRVRESDLGAPAHVGARVRADTPRGSRGTPAVE